MKPQPARAPIKKSLSVYPKSLSSFWEEVEQLADHLENRAYEIFEERGRADGLDMEDWLKAESELFRPVAIDIAEDDGSLHIRADVPGFAAEELELNLQPGTLTLIGAHRSETKKKEEELDVVESRSAELFRRILLPVNVDPEKATAKLTGGVLEIDAPKAEETEKIEITAA